MAGNLGVFYAKVRAEHWKTGEEVESKSMVYMIEGNIVLVSRAVLEMLGCIPRHFPRVGEFLEADDKAVTGKSFLVFRGKGMSEGKAANDDNEAVEIPWPWLTKGAGGGEFLGGPSPPAWAWVQYTPWYGRTTGW